MLFNLSVQFGFCADRADNRVTMPPLSEKELGRKKSRSASFLHCLMNSQSYRIEPLICEEVMHKPPVIIPYVSAIGAHTNYWRDYDTALFMLKHLYRDIAEEPDLSSEELEGSSRSRLKGWCRPREILDEELPLTFADRVFI